MKPALYPLEKPPTMTTKKIGDVILDVKNISLRFGGVKALTDISFNVKEHEIRAIIGPNGAGKSSMLNCINGVYTPQDGSITFRGKTFSHMNSRQVAEMGVARTFQNLALFKGMSVIDNIMTGRNLKIKSNLLMQALRIGPAEREEIRHREYVEHIIDFLEIQAYRKTPVGQLPYGLQKRVDLGRALAMEPQVLLLDEPMAGMNVEEKQDMCRFILDVNDEFGTTIVLIEHDMRGDGHQRPRGGAGLRQEDRRRHARRGAQQPGRDQRLPGHIALKPPKAQETTTWDFFLKHCWAASWPACCIRWWRWALC